MPQSREAVHLEPGPTCVQQARRWAAAVCRELGREDLVESAELGVSELVTNAVLHAEAPITLRVRGTRSHPRLEVSDSSPHPPVLSPPSFADDVDEIDLLMTVGRGLSMVAMNSAAWGAEITREGKVVWFEPTAEPREDADLTGEVFDATADDEADVADALTVHLLHLPLAPYREFRRHYSELRREVRLLALAHENDYPLAKELSQLFDTFEHHIDHASTTARVEAALVAGEEHADVDVAVGPGAPQLIGQMLELLDLADAFCRAQRLLSLARTNEQRAFQRWFLTQIGVQAEGRAPTAWSEPSPSTSAGSDDAHAS